MNNKKLCVMHNPDMANETEEEADKKVECFLMERLQRFIDYVQTNANKGEYPIPSFHKRKHIDYLKNKVYWFWKYYVT